MHQSERGRATEKAKDLVRMAVSRVSLLEPLYDYSYQVVQRALVIGGGLAGLTAALSVAEQGFPAVLVEKTAELGGNAKNLFYTEDGAEPARYVEELIRKVESNKLITVHKEAEVVSIKGACGNFSTTLSVGGKEVEVSHGVGIVAAGGREYKPTEYLYGQDKRVLTQKEFEKLLVEDPSAVKNLLNVTMIQCVGSREPEHSYCSRVCCTSAVKNSVKLKEINPGANVSVLYRDIRTFGFKELAYQEARRRGVRFFRYEEDKKPIVEQNGGGLEVTFQDAQLLRPVTVKSDLLVLSAAIRPSETTAKLAETLRLPLDQDGFFLEAHLKLRPLDFATAGFFLCGLAQGPKFANESIAQARGAVSRAADDTFAEGDSCRGGHYAGRSGALPGLRRVRAGLSIRCDKGHTTGKRKEAGHGYPGALHRLRRVQRRLSDRRRIACPLPRQADQCSDPGIIRNVDVRFIRTQDPRVFV